VANVPQKHGQHVEERLQFQGLRVSWISNNRVDTRMNVCPYLVMVWSVLVDMLFEGVGPRDPNPIKNGPWFSRS